MTQGFPLFPTKNPSAILKNIPPNVTWYYNARRTSRLSFRVAPIDEHEILHSELESASMSVHPTIGVLSICLGGRG